MSGKKKTNETSKKIGFYAALLVCLVAVGVAAWSTYDAVQTYDATADYDYGLTIPSGINAEDDQDPSDEDGQALIENRDKNTIKEESKPADAPVQSSDEANSPVENQPVKDDTEGEVSDSGATQGETEFETPVNAGVVYEVSTVMHYPLESKDIVKNYSSDVPVYSETMRDWRTHQGSDIAAEANEDVKACANGMVKAVGTDRLLGNYIVVEHGEYEFTYCGIDENFIVAEGDVVDAGQKIASIAAVPSEAADAPHLHLEAKRDNVSLNPIEVLTQLSGE